MFTPLKTTLTYSNLKWLIKNDTLVVILGDKASCVIIMDKVDYVTKMEEMIKNGIQKGVYVETEDNTLRDLKHFQDFLYRNFKNNEHYNKMYPTSNQPAQLYGTAKTHKHENIDGINVQYLNFRPIIAQTGTCTYNAAQVISNYQSLYTLAMNTLSATHRIYQKLSRNNHHYSWTRSMCHII